MNPTIITELLKLVLQIYFHTQRQLGKSEAEIDSDFQKMKKDLQNYKPEDLPDV